MTDLSDFRSAVGAALRDFAGDITGGLLGDLLGTGPNQHTRLLRLHTPLGADVLLAERAVITEGIGPGAPEAVHAWDGLAHLAAPGAFGIDLLALSTHAALDPADIMGRPVLLELLTAHSLTELRPFHGHVQAFELLGSDGGYARYRLRIGAWLDFLRHRTDSWVFQGRSVIDITDSIFADYTAQGLLRPAWRWDLQDPDSYLRLGTFSQHEETDFGFLTRLWSANGLFHWFEHTGDAGDTSSLGTHTLVIADHNGAFKPHAQGRVRFTQAGAVMKEDSITQWHGVRRLGATALHTASHDYRCVSNHTGSFETDAGHEQPMALVHTDQPGAYAFESPSEAGRLAQVQLQSLEAMRKRFMGRGTVRTLSPATTFVLADHAEHDADIASGGEDAARFAVLSVVHRARNNLSADAKAGLQHLLGDALLGDDGHDGRGQPRDGATGPDPHGERSTAGNDSQEPLYEARFTAQRASVPYRPPMRAQGGRLLHAGPTAAGAQTALVVGVGGPIHTDRDGRVKVQFHWQRGARGSHRLSHDAGDNAPASDASGTWVRVGQGWAGANWGGVQIPRLGQEVVLAFVEGDIDRPVVVGAAYNGEGSVDAQGNVVAGGAAGATGNAPAWFPGAARHGELEGHAHTATLSGFKSQSLEASQEGGGGHNQLVFDDTPGQGRVLAHTTQSQTWLQMGHLLQQHDNQRLTRRGHGLELHTQAQGAVRAGSGLHISTHGGACGTATLQGQPMQTREARAQLQMHAELLQALNDNAQTHLAKLPGEPAPDKLDAQQALQATLQSLLGVASSHVDGGHDPDGAPDAAGGGSVLARTIAIDGGHGSMPVLARPDLVLSAAADIASATPAHTVVSTGRHATVTAGQDTGILSQRHMAWAVKDGISLFTRGEARAGQRAVQDAGMKLHAASGGVNVQAQGDRFTLTAQQAVDVQSTAGSVVISAPEKIVLNGSGGYIRIEGGDIEIGTSGAAQFKGGMKELTGGGSANPDGFDSPKAKPLFDEQIVLKDELSGEPLAFRPYRIELPDGSSVRGITDENGRTSRIYTKSAQNLRVFLA